MEQFGFPYTSLRDAEIKAGNLNARYDVVILPAAAPAAITGEPAGARGAGEGGGPQGRAGQFGRPQSYPPEYESGIGREGVDGLRAFVEKGGVLLTFGEAGTLAIERFGLPLRNVVAERKSTEFWCPGSTLKVKFNAAHPLGYGMPAQGLAVFLAGSQAYEILPTDFNDRIETVAAFVERDILQSGWLLGEETLARKAAMVSVKLGQGRVVLIGFRAQHRAQAHGTFKLVFNTLVNGPDAAPARSSNGEGR
ncbi:MAG: hypothetical protein DMG07_03050 [Acidobacteria bacterium]|nr:MAG: hypothetical protein DMG07_03050 [Acidobacteriota bacterium]